MRGQKGLAKIPRVKNSDAYDKYTIQERFLEALRIGGNVAVAIEWAQEVIRRPDGKVVRQPAKGTFYNWREADPDFKAAWDDAIAARLGQVEAKLYQLADGSRRDEVQLNAAKFILSRLDRSRFGGAQEGRPAQIVVRMAVPEPIKPEDLPEATEEELLGLTLPTPSPEHAERNEDGVPG